jgi:hypothetical protein
VHGAGVALRLATEDEVEALKRARHGRGLRLEPSRSHTYVERPQPLATDEVYVVSQAFVEFTDGGGTERWVSYEHHGHIVSVLSDATMELLELAGDAAEDLVDLLADMRIAGLGVTRWELMSAPRRIELTSDLEARLAPLRRG